MRGQGGREGERERGREGGREGGREIVRGKEINNNMIVYMKTRDLTLITSISLTLSFCTKLSSLSF